MGLLTCLQPAFREPALILRILPQGLILGDPDGHAGAHDRRDRASSGRDGEPHLNADLEMRNGIEFIPRSAFRIPHFRDGSSSTVNGPWQSPPCDSSLFSPDRAGRPWTFGNGYDSSGRSDCELTLVRGAASIGPGMIGQILTTSGSWRAGSLPHRWSVRG